MNVTDENYAQVLNSLSNRAVTSNIPVKSWSDAEFTKIFSSHFPIHKLMLDEQIVHAKIFLNWYTGTPLTSPQTVSCLIFHAVGGWHNENDKPWFEVAGVYAGGDAAKPATHFSQTNTNSTCRKTQEDIPNDYFRGTSQILAQRV